MRTEGVWITKPTKEHERCESLSCVSLPFAPFVSKVALDEQRRIGTHLDGLQARVDQLTALQLATQAELDALLPSVLDRAFRGEL